MYKKVIAMFLSICISAQLIPAVVYAQENAEQTLQTENENTSGLDEDIVNTSSAVTLKSKTVAEIIEKSKFRVHQGHGFAAECANNLADNVKGKNAQIVGDDYKKNGPDRLILNRDGTKIWIQDKYYKTAKEGIDACFDDLGNFRYIDIDGNPMVIEVPADQYDDAVMYMRQKIESGKIPNVSDPNEAKNYVKKGCCTYQQAKNIAKAGKIDALKYDAVNGTISAVPAFGISTLVNYAVNRFSGKSREESLKRSAKEGLITGGAVFGSSVISAQLARTGLMDVFKPSSEALVKALGDDFANMLVQSTGKTGAKLTAEQVTQQAAKALRSNVLADTVTIMAFSTRDAINLFQGRISKEQFIKNLAVTAASVAAGSAGTFVGGAVGNAIVPGGGALPGAIVGSFVFGAVGGWGADIIADQFIDDDDVKMYEIVQNSFVQKCEDYVLNEAEAQNVANNLNEMLTEDMFKDMYQSENREQFIEEKLTPLFEQEVAKREVIAAPTEEEMREALKSELEGVIFIH